MYGNVSDTSRVTTPDRDTFVTPLNWPHSVLRHSPGPEKPRDLYVPGLPGGPHTPASSEGTTRCCFFK
jgi:hypothetical protein